jgi:hypothetical protein
MGRTICLLLAQLFVLCGSFGFAQKASTGALSGAAFVPIGKKARRERLFSAVQRPEAAQNSTYA